MNKDQIKSVLFGVAIGDALGVPVEFESRSYLEENPVTVMQTGGVHDQPAGTFSDDSSLTFCLAEALTKEFNLDELGAYMVRWYYDNFWTAHGEVFDIGITTQAAIERISNGVELDKTGEYSENSNGNGSLMRIAPLVFYVHDMALDERFACVKKVSALTHGHIRSVLACMYFIEFALGLLRNSDKYEVYHALQNQFCEMLTLLGIAVEESTVFDRLLRGSIYKLDSSDIQSSGYVVHTLEASIWCLLTTHTFEEAVLAAVNLGEDTDTTAAVTGALAGIVYGVDAIPDEWLNVLARRTDIEDLAERMSIKLAEN